jgi:hypothetical protein
MVTTLNGQEVLQRAKRFFAERVPHHGAFVEREGERFATFRGQGGEELTIAVFEAPNGDTHIRASTPAHTVKVWVPVVWDTVELEVTPEWTVARLKREAFERATGRRLDANAYQVKFRGALVLDESRTLADLRAPNHAPFIVLLARRQPVR